MKNLQDELLEKGFLLKRKHRGTEVISSTAKFAKMVTDLQEGNVGRLITNKMITDYIKTF